MSVHESSETNFVNRQRGLLSWLGAGSALRRLKGLHPAGAEDAAEDQREQRRQELFAEIGGFLMTHRLEVNPYTLAIAHDVVTGADQRIARLIQRRSESGLPVTMDWLEEASRAANRGDTAAALNALMAKLEASLEDFGKTTTAARTATTEYNSALQAHVGELEQVSKAGVVISELATIARLMLERTREIEQEMSRSEMQTRALQESLEEARRKAEIDHLTGLPNRCAFEKVLQRELEAAREAQEALCVAFCDIDHFKRINDTHGHEAGDRVLKVVAQTLAQISDDRCHVSRHGGEEFVILFRGKTLDQAWQTLNDAREAMAERNLINRATDIPFGRVTFSGGIADVFAHPSHREALKAADDALYAAKNSGRNQIFRAGIDEVKVAA